MIPLTSDELNLLVFRYLQESGFTHSAFSLGYEAGIDKSPIDGSSIPPKALFNTVQRGLQYLEIESTLPNTDADVDEDLSSLTPLDLISKDVNELYRIVKEKRKEPEKESERMVKEGEKHTEHYSNKEMVTDKKGKVIAKHEETEVPRGKGPMYIPTSTFQFAEIPSSDVTILEGHTSEVHICAWNPADSLLASGSKDSTARIWTIADGPSKVLVLKHVMDTTDEKIKGVRTLDWNGEGTLLATGSYDGKARIWTKYGELKSTLSKHKGPIFSLKWSKKGDYLVTGSRDNTTILWDMKKAKLKRQYELHSGPTLDVDWRNNSSFATSSADKMIYVCGIGDGSALKTFAGHEGEVNCVKWNPTGSLLASCSNDRTAKIWSMRREYKGFAVHDLRGHTKGVSTIRWSPSGEETDNPYFQLVLASASYDSTVKLWDMELGSCLYTLDGHMEAVHSVAFSPDSEYLASGSTDKSIKIWSVKDGKMVKTYTGGGGIHGVCWNKRGDKVAACSDTNSVSVLDFRMFDFRM